MNNPFSNLANTIQAQKFAPNIPVGSSIGQILTGGGVNLVNFAFFIAGLVFFFNLLGASVQYLGSGGDPRKLQSASSSLINNLIGLMVVLGSFILIQIVVRMIGFQNYTPLQ